MLKQVSWLQDFISLFFPNVCMGCHEPLPKGVPYICPLCRLNLPKTDNHKVAVPRFEQKFYGLIDYRYVLVYLYFNKRGIVQKVLHELKYGHKPEIGSLLGRWYGHELLDAGFSDDFDVIVPVPLHRRRQLSRGYNQSETFAKGLAEVLKIPLSPDGLIRTRATETQTRKSRRERWTNTEHIFELRYPGHFRDKHLLLVDDVLTTGATLVSCAGTLMNAGPATISFGLIASAP